MSLNRERLKQVIEDLGRQREVIDDALRSLLAIEKTFEGNTEAKSVVPLPSSPKRIKRKHELPPAGFYCSKHPGEHQFSKKGKCKLCQSELMKEYWRRTKKRNSNTDPRLADSKDESGVKALRDESDFVFSPQQRCPKCGLMTRFRRLRDAGPSDHWTCLGTRCELRVASYKIVIDRDYEPKPTASMPVSV